jgi:hypothetical protein
LVDSEKVIYCVIPLSIYVVIGRDYS